MPRKPQPPSFVFAESLPELAKLRNATPDDQDAIMRGFKSDADVARSIAERDLQDGPHKGHRELRARVMAHYRPGRRGEATRLAKWAEGQGETLSRRTVERWISEARKVGERTPAGASASAPLTAQEIVYGQLVRESYRQMGKARRKK